MKINYDKYPLPKRVRHHTSPNLYFKYEDFKVKPGYYPPLIKSLDWSMVFSNGKSPEILDVGCGKGIFLLELSEQYPDKNILGIELRKPLTDWINNYVEGEGIQNAVALWYSVINGMSFINSQSIDKIFYLFPDPWHKQRHIKRRAFTVEFLSEVFRVIKDGGRLYLATDVLEIDKYHKKILDKFSKFDFINVERDDEWGFPCTNKERFCRKKNIPFYRIICQKK